MRAGMRFRWFGQGNPDYQWGDLVAFIETLPRDAALARQLLGDDAEWGTQEQLLAMVADQIALFRYSFMGKGAPPPKLITQMMSSSAPAHRLPPSTVGDDRPVEAEDVDLNDRNASGVATGEVWSTEKIAQSLGWA